MIIPVTDNSLMPFGKFKGRPMANVPAPYLLWLYNNNCNHQGVKRYIVSNLELLNREAAAIPKR